MQFLADTHGNGLCTHAEVIASEASAREMDAEVIVPGHGQITDAAGVKRVQEYLSYMNVEARKRYDAGLSVRDAVLDIALTDYDSWSDSERIADNIDTLYREYSGNKEAANSLELFGLILVVAVRSRHQLAWTVTDHSGFHPSNGLTLLVL